jgi:cyclopropane-fatty-acyl-phospholipid synthase
MARPSDLRIKNPLFFKRVLQEGSLGLGESYMDGWWDCERLDIFFHKVLRAGLENQLPHHLKDTLRIAALACLIYKVKSAPGLSAKNITTSATIFSAVCSTPICNIPARTGKRRNRWKRRRWQN